VAGDASALFGNGQRLVRGQAPSSADDHNFVNVRLERIEEAVNVALAVARDAAQADFRSVGHIASEVIAWGELRKPKKTAAPENPRRRRPTYARN
jgi:hypothetical protein